MPSAPGNPEERVPRRRIGAVASGGSLIPELVSGWRVASGACGGDRSQPALRQNDRGATAGLGKVKIAFGKWEVATDLPADAGGDSPTSCARFGAHLACLFVVPGLKPEATLSRRFAAEISWPLPGRNAA